MPVSHLYRFSQYCFLLKFPSSLSVCRKFFYSRSYWCLMSFLHLIFSEIFLTRVPHLAICTPSALSIHRIHDKGLRKRAMLAAVRSRIPFFLISRSDISRNRHHYFDIALLIQKITTVRSQRVRFRKKYCARYSLRVHDSQFKRTQDPARALGVGSMFPMFVLPGEELHSNVKTYGVLSISLTPNGTLSLLSVQRFTLFTFELPSQIEISTYYVELCFLQIGLKISTSLVRSSTYTLCLQS